MKCIHSHKPLTETIMKKAGPPAQPEIIQEGDSGFASNLGAGHIGQQVESAHVLGKEHRGTLSNLEYTAPASCEKPIRACARCII